MKDTNRVKKVTNRVKKVTRMWKATITTTITKATTVIIITNTRKSYSRLPLKKALRLVLEQLSLATISEVIKVTTIIMVTTTTMATAPTARNPLKLVSRRVWTRRSLLKRRPLSAIATVTNADLMDHEGRMQTSRPQALASPNICHLLRTVRRTPVLITSVLPL